MPHIHSIAPVISEPAWHRNLRARRHRARVLVKVAKKGITVDGDRLTAARQLLAAHHGTRGHNDVVIMGKNKNGPNQNDWRCPKQGCRCKPNGEDLWNWGRVEKCHQCGAAKPKNPKLYSQTQEGKDRLAAGGAKGGPKAVGNGGGGGGPKTNAQLKAELQVEKDKTAMLSKKNTAASDKAEQEEARKLKAELAKEKKRGETLKASTDDVATAGAVEDDAGGSMDAQVLEIDLKHTEEDLKTAAQKLKDRPQGTRGHEQAFQNHEDLKLQLDDLRKAKRDSKDPHEQLWKKSQRIVKLQDYNKSLCTQLASKLEEQEEAAEAAAKLAERIENNKKEMSELQVQAAALTAARSDQAAPDLATVAQTQYTELLGKFGNPLLTADPSITSKKTELEAMYAGFAKMLEEMAKCHAMLDGAAEKAAREAATRAAQSTPPEGSIAADNGSTGVLAITTALRPDGGTARDTPYTAATVIARPTRTTQSASSDAGSAASPSQQAAKAKPPRERTEAELLASVAKLSRTTPVSDMDQ